MNRYYGHFEGDQQTYRGDNEVEKVRETRDCINNFAERVTSAGIVDASEIEEINQEVSQQVEGSVSKAKAAPKPEAPDLLTDVYVAY